MRSVLTAAAAVCAMALTAIPAQAVPARSADALPTVEGVPVLAQTWIGGPSGTPEAVLTVHGVRRVDGGTVLYYSMGIPEGTDVTSTAFFSSYGGGFYNTLSQRPGSSQLMCDAAAIDVAGGKAYTALRTGSASRCLSTPASAGFKATPQAPHAAKVAYTIVAPVPDSVTKVDVFIGSQLLQDVPVEDGLLEPVSADESPVVGTGWPKVDTASVTTAVEPDGAVFALTSRVQDIEKKVTEAKGKQGSSLEIDAKVLFASDSSTLTGSASSVIATVAASIKAAGTSGTVVVTGHTDSTNTDAYNLALSKRRAASVVAALKPQVPSGITLRAVGKGETEPIASNATEQGRALNRRVTVTLPGK